MGGIEERIATVAADTGFSGVVRVDAPDGSIMAAAFGDASRAYRVPNTVATRFGIASGTKGLTALVVISLVAEGVLRLDTTARAVLGSDLPLISDAVTVEHLLAHPVGYRRLRRRRSRGRGRTSRAGADADNDRRLRRRP